MLGLCWICIQLRGCEDVGLHLGAQSSVKSENLQALLLYLHLLVVAVEVVWRCCGGVVNVLWMCFGCAVKVLWGCCGNSPSPRSNLMIYLPRDMLFDLACAASCAAS